LHQGPKIVRDLHLTGRIYECICTYCPTVRLSLDVHGGSIYVAKFDFGGKIQKPDIRNSMGYRPQNSRKRKFATEPLQTPKFSKKQICDIYGPAAGVKGRSNCYTQEGRGRQLSGLLRKGVMSPSGLDDIRASPPQ
jgi:hypothetical protein